MDFARSNAYEADLWADAALADDVTAAFSGLPGRFCMFYQPDIDLQTGALSGCEALLRWWHPDFGMLRPNATLRGTKWTAEIPGIEAWAMAAVCRQSATWSQEGHPIQVALNVSAPHLGSDEFLPSIDEALDAADLDPRHLAVDVPVAALATDPIAVGRIADGIAARGISVVIDGVSGTIGLETLEAIGAEVWKIDLWSRPRRRPGMHPSVATALTRARRVGVTTVAKAVETPDALARVQAMGFDRAFGHAVSPAVTHEAMSALLRGPRSTPLRVPLTPT